jgi:SAM-dependent methyltransferase
MISSKKMISYRKVTSLIKEIFPTAVLDFVRRRRRDGTLFIRRRMSNEQIFSKIYAENRWGGQKGDFCSGTGSTSDTVVTAYVDTIKRLATERGFVGTRFVDLGCGDFRVGQRLLPLCSSYVGVDVVPSLVDRNSRAFGSQTTRFLARDLSRDELPEGDVCFVRQVFQHLSNAEIMAILPKLHRYRWVFITEHQPGASSLIAPNIDKVHGEDIRVAFGSGVFLDKPPFNLPGESLEAVLELPGTGLGPGVDPGVIRTTLYTPGHGTSAHDPFGSR